jgi:hypothetical protein
MEAASGASGNVDVAVDNIDVALGEDTCAGAVGDIVADRPIVRSSINCRAMKDFEIRCTFKRNNLGVSRKEK